MFGFSETTAAADVTIDRRAELTPQSARPKTPNLDDVDFGRQVARHFETDFLLADFRLRPDLHECFLQSGILLPNSQTPPRAYPLVQAHFCAAPICGRVRQSQEQPPLIRYRTRMRSGTQIKSFHVCV
jgi:hypothetical protein